ncbi:hypothetical protein D9M72_323030 [compost metagenome]
MDQGRPVQIGDRGDDGKAADEFRNQPELQQVFRHDLAVGVGVVLDFVQRSAEAYALAAGTGADDVLEPGEGPRDNEQHIGGVDLDEFLVRVFPAALRGHRGHRAFQDLQEGLLHALA